MALGARESSPEELEELFRISGTLHLFAVSGMNVAIIAGLFLGFALLFRIPRHYAVIIVIPFVLFYALLTGLSPSAVRAAVMLSTFLAAYAAREKPRLLNSLGLAALIVLLYDSQQLFLPGFQLSFRLHPDFFRKAPVMGRHFVRTENLGQLVGHAFRQTPRIHENQAAAMGGNQCGKPLVDPIRQLRLLRREIIGTLEWQS